MIPLVGTIRYQVRMTIKNISYVDGQRVETVVPESSKDKFLVRLVKPGNNIENILDFTVPEAGVIEFYQDLDIHGNYQAAATVIREDGSRYPTTSLRWSTRRGLFDDGGV